MERRSEGLRHSLWFALLGITMTLASPFATAVAQETVPGDSCAGVAGGTLRQTGGAGEATGHTLVCNGTTWRPILSYHYNSGTGVVSLRRVGSTLNQNSFVLGLNAAVSNWDSFAFGEHSDGAERSVGLGGLWAEALGTKSVALGNHIRVSATESVGIKAGLSSWDHMTTMSSAAINSIAMFMGPHADVTITAPNTFGVFGGRMILDPANPATKLSVSTGTGGALAMDVEGNIGAMNYCDEAGDNCFTAASVSGSSGIWQKGAGDVVYYNSGTPLVGIGLTNPDVALDVDGDIEYSGTIRDVSDRRMKDNVRSLLGEQGEAIGNLIPVSFAMKEGDNTRELGFIAQDVEQVFPELVHTNLNGDKSMNYVGLIAPMVKAIQQLQTENEELNAMADTLLGSEQDTAKPVQPAASTGLND